MKRLLTAMIDCSRQTGFWFFGNIETQKITLSEELYFSDATQIFISTVHVQAEMVTVFPVALSGNRGYPMQSVTFKVPKGWKIEQAHVQVPIVL